MAASDLPRPYSYRVRLALDLIEEHFGDITKDVAHLVTMIDQCTITTLQRVAQTSLQGDRKLTPRQIRQSLLILLKHNCLVVEMPHDTDLSEITDSSNQVEQKLNIVGLLYRLDVDAVLNRMRFGRIFCIVRKKFAPIAMNIMEEVMVHGRLRYGSLRDLLTSQGVEDDIQAAFESLVQHRFLVNVPPLDVKHRQLAESELSSKSSRKAAMVFDSLAGSVPVPKAVKGRAGGQKRSRDDMNGGAGDASLSNPQELLPVELRMMMEQERRLETEGPDATGMRSSSAGRGQAFGRGAGPADVAGGRGRGRGRGRGSAAVAAAAAAARDISDTTSSSGRGADGGRAEPWASSTASDAPSNGSNGSHAYFPPSTSMIREEAYWTIGHDQLVREERHRACASIVVDQLEQYAGDIVQVILQQSMSQELGPRPSKSSPLGIAEIHRRLNEHYASAGSSSSGSSGGDGGLSGAAHGKELSMEMLKRLMELMRVSSLQAIFKVAGSDAEQGGPQFVVNYDSLLSALRKRTIHRIAVGRYGLYSARIVELLYTHKYLEQQAVGDRAILPARETRERLYRLLRDNWVSYLELSKRGDFNPSSSTYFWFLDMPKLRESLLEHLFKAMYNLRLRRTSELAKNKELLELVQSSAAVSQVDQAQYQALMTRVAALTQTMSHLDSTLLLMDRF